MLSLPAGFELEFVFAGKGSDEDWLARQDHVLSHEELERRAGFRSRSRRVSFSLGRIAARRVVARVLGCAPTDVPLRVAEDGAVDVVMPTEGKALHLSISHTDDAAVAVVAPTPVGADIEPVGRAIADLRSYILSADEDRTILGMEDQNLAVLRSWVAKESVLKGRRTGLRTSPKSVRLFFDEDGGLARTDEGGLWRFRMAESAGLILSVAYPET